MQDKNYKEIKPNFTGTDESIVRGTTSGVEKIQRDSNVRQQNIGNALNVIQNLGTVTKTAQEINVKENNKVLMSGQSALTNLGLKYQNEIVEIDSKKIPLDKKLEQKILLQAKYEGESKQILENIKNNKALFSGVLETEENFNFAVENLSLQQQNLQLQIKKDNQATKQELENEITSANIQNSFDLINASANLNEIQKNGNSVAKNIKDALLNGNITQGQASLYYGNLSEKYNNRSVDIFLDNIQTNVIAGNISQAQALDLVKREFVLSVNGKNFNKAFNGVSQVNRLQANEKLRKFLALKENTEVSSQVIGYNITYDEAVAQIENRPCDLGDVECNKIKAQQKQLIGEQIAKRDDRTNADYTKEIMQQFLGSGRQTFINAEGREVAINIDDPKIVNEWQKANGKGYYSSLDKGQIASFKASYENIYNTGKPADVVNAYNQWVSERIKEFGNLENVEKEVGYHLSDEASIMLKMYKNSNGRLSNAQYETLSTFISAEKQIKNGDKPKPAEGQAKDIKNKFDKTDYAKWLIATGQWGEYNKVYKGLKNITLVNNPKSTGREVTDFVKAMTGTRDFIATDGVAISFDSSKYTDKNAIKQKINTIKNRPELIKDFVLTTAKNNVIDASNSFYFQGDGEEIIMYTEGTYTGGKTAIAKFTIQDLLFIKTEFDKTASPFKRNLINEKNF
jgi:hypothetical protein